MYSREKKRHKNGEEKKYLRTTRVEVLMRQYLCDCEQCLALNFDICNDDNLLEKNDQPLHPIDNEDDVLLDDECVMDEDYGDFDKVSQFYDFIELPLRDLLP